MDYSKFLKQIITLKRIKGASRISKAFNEKYPALSKTEYEEVKSIWKVKLGDSYLPVSQKGFRLFKELEGFDPTYCDETIFPHYLLRSLNPPVHVLGFEHKAMYDQIFPLLPKPKTIFKCVNGILYDHNMHIRSLEECFALAKFFPSVCIKITTFSACGQGVKKVEVEHLSFVDFKNTLEKFGNNYIVQEILKQSSKTSRLSKSSLNTFRISTLFINGKCTICTIINRIGRGCSFVDNGLAGNLVVGVDCEGKFRDYAYDKNYIKYTKTDTGIEFKNLQLDEVRKLVDLVIELHPKYLPQCGFCGWDFALDEQDVWNLIEINLYAPGVEMEQLCPGRTLFGNRTTEVIEWVNNHQPSMMSILTSLAFV